MTEDQTLDLFCGPKIGPQVAHSFHTSTSMCNEHVKQYWREIITF